MKGTCTITKEIVSRMIVLHFLWYYSVFLLLLFHCCLKQRDSCEWNVVFLFNSCIFIDLQIFRKKVLDGENIK